MKARSSGIDITSADRIRSSASRARFLERVFTREEAGYCFGRRHPYRHLAGRFAAKEACLKALTTGLSEGIDWKDIEVVRSPSGRPELRLHGEARRFLGGRNAFLSISYEKGLAIALVVIG